MRLPCHHYCHLSVMRLLAARSGVASRHLSGRPWRSGPSASLATATRSCASGQNSHSHVPSKGPTHTYNHTVSLPKTLFPLRADANRRESLFRPRTTNQLYERQWQRWANDGRAADGVFVLHDGPPYANGDLHMGHALNKILKDMINRYQLLSGRTVHYVPGWDCHGLPIELKALTELGMERVQAQQAAAAATRKNPNAGGGVQIDRAQAKAFKAACKGDKEAQAKLAQAAAAHMDPLAIRRAARSKAENAVAAQREQFEDLGIMAGWDLGPGQSGSTDAGDKTVDKLRQGGGVYRTLDSAYEGAQLEVFARMVDRGLVYRAERPTYWSPSSGTALAEAELEYSDRQATAAYVRFPLHTLGLGLRDALANVPLTAEAAGVVRHLLKAPPGKGSNLVVWTTTPWTLPANMAVAVHPDLVYALVQSTSGALDWVATDRLEAIGSLLNLEKEDGVSADQPIVLLAVPGHRLAGSTYTHPFLRPETATGGEGQATILSANWVSAASGTGLVHCAPAHGAEDYELLRAKGIAGPGRQRGLYSPVDAQGQYSPSLATDPPAHTGGEASTADLVGLEVLTEGNKAVLEKIARLPAASFPPETHGHVSILVHSHRVEHREPMDWRTGGPVLTRATTQWFTDLGPLQGAALSAIGEETISGQQHQAHQLRCYPPAGRSRLRAHVRGRAEWCISRQRAWGVPIPVVYAPDGTAILTGANVRHIASVLRERGADAWWTDPGEDFVLPELRAAHSAGDQSWTTGRDTLDVWFDSGASWAHLQSNLLKPLSADLSMRQPLADVYLEGSDQHRGWFQSALLTAVAASDAPHSDTSTLTKAGSGGKFHGRAAAPYANLITHGMVVDPSGRKMSKSVGNTLAPQTVLRGGKAPEGQMPPMGADVLRFWAARTDTSRDAPVGKAILAQSADGLRRLRNVTRFLLSNLRGYLGHGPFPVMGSRQAQQAPPGEVVAYMQVSEHLLLSQLSTAINEINEAFAAYDFSLAARNLSDLATGPLSGLYLDSAKDALYTDPLHGPRRTAILATMEIAFRSLLAAIAPIAPHLAEEAWEYRRRETPGYLGLLAVPEDAIEGDARIQGSVFDLGWQPVPPVWDATRAKQGEQLLSLRTSLLSVIEAARNKSLLGTALEADVSFVVPAEQTDEGLVKALEENRASRHSLHPSSLC